MLDSKWRNVRGGAAAAAPAPSVRSRISAARIALEVAGGRTRALWPDRLIEADLALGGALDCLGRRDLHGAAADVEAAIAELAGAHLAVALDLVAEAREAVHAQLDAEWVWSGAAAARAAS